MPSAMKECWRRKAEALRPEPRPASWPSERTGGARESQLAIQSMLTCWRLLISTRLEKQRFYRGWNFKQGSAPLPLPDPYPLGRSEVKFLARLDVESCIPRIDVADGGSTEFRGGMRVRHYL